MNRSAEEIEVITNLIDQLEDRRVLYNILESEVMGFVIESIQQIRDYIGVELVKVKRNSELHKKLRVMQNACGTFLTKTQVTSDWREKDRALLELRESFFTSISYMINVYEIELDKETSNIRKAIELYEKMKLK